MTKFTDGKRTASIYMGYWVENSYTPDFSADFFEVGGLEADENGCYIVPSVSYCIEQAEDWRKCEGDYYGDDRDDPYHTDRVVYAEEYDLN